MKSSKQCPICDVKGMKRGLSHQPDVGKKTLDRHLISPYVNTMSGLDINSWFVAQGVFLMSETFCSGEEGEGAEVTNHSEKEVGEILKVEG